MKMASIGKYKAKDGSIYSRILFVDPKDGRRRTIRLGRVNKEQARTFKSMIERLVRNRETGTPDPASAAWLAELPDAIHRKIVKVGLAEPRAAQAPTAEPKQEPKRRLGEFLDAYLKDRSDLKPGSKLVYGHTRRNLLVFFGADKPLADITEYDGKQWQRYLSSEGLSKATVRKRTQNAKTFLQAAVEQGSIASNPFRKLKSTSVPNKDRQYFVSREDTQKVMDACPDAQWRLIVALCRYGGLRCTSEVLALKWADVNWDQKRILVHSPKTEHHEGKETRLIPLFPELHGPLMDVLEQSDSKTEYVITRYRKANCNLRTQLERIIGRAGLKSWPRLFQNLRSSRETELAETYPVHVVTAWIGNTPEVAKDHYLQMRDEYFQRAAASPEDTSKAAHRAAQSAAVSGSKESWTQAESLSATPLLSPETASDELMQVLTGQILGGGGIRTPVPRCFRISIYVRSRSICEFRLTQRRATSPAIN